MSKINTVFIGNVVLHLAEVSSTNAYAIDCITKSDPSEGTVISASYQTAGRGQIGSSWQSEAGKNLLMSIILYPRFLPVNRQFLLNQIAALAITDTTTALGITSAQVKWPNDIYLHSNKTAGILIQNGLQAGYIQWTVIGIGLNVNQRVFDPALPNPTALAQVAGYDFSLEEVQHTLLQKLEQRYLQLRAQRYDEIEADYLKRLYLFQVKATYRRANGTEFMGQITGLNPNGKLAIATAEGTEYFGVKEVTFI